MRDKLLTATTRLISELSSEHYQHRYRYLLFDRLGVVSELSSIFDETLLETMPSDRLAVVKRPDLAHDLSVCPLLVCIANPHESLDEKLLSAAVMQIKKEYLTKKQYVCGFITSVLTPEQLAEEFLKTYYRAGNALNKKILPFYEPFRLDVIRHSYIQPDSHLGLLLPAETSYSFIDTDCDVYTFKSIDYRNDFDFELRFTNQLLHYNQLNQFELYRIAVILTDLYEEYDKPQPQKLLSQIINYFYDHNGTKLKNPNDRRVYVLFCIIYGQLTQNEKLTAIVNDVIDNEEMQGELGTLLSQEKQALSSLKK